MERIVKELKEDLLNKEMSLVEMDNKVEQTTGSTTSLFDFTDECLKQMSCAYYINEDKNIIVEFEIINKNEDDIAETIVKVTDVWEN